MESVSKSEFSLRYILGLCENVKHTRKSPIWGNLYKFSWFVDTVLFREFITQTSCFTLPLSVLVCIAPNGVINTEDIVFSLGPQFPCLDTQ